MPNHRYHVHVACVADDPLLTTVLDDVAIFFESRAFLTKDLVVARAESVSYSWRCVNAADVVLVFVGDSYGRVNASGVSQLHVNYTNAKTKNKPMLIFVHSNAIRESSDNRKLIDFVGSLENQESGHIHYFDDKTHFPKLLASAFDTLDFDKTKGWQAVGSDIKNMLLSPSSEPSKMESKPQKVEKSSQEVDEGVSPKTGINNVNATLKPALVLDGEFLVSCTAHAFQGGTLIEVSFVVPLTWRQVITMLVNIIMPFSEQGLGRALNEIIDKGLANRLVSQQYPDVHAVSRVQVVRADALWILDELELAEWIEPVGQGSLWRATRKAFDIKK